jgi:hypothetical protein
VIVSAILNFNERGEVKYIMPGSGEHDILFKELKISVMNLYEYYILFIT